MPMQHKPMSRLYEATRLFLEHADNDIGQADFDYQFSMYTQLPSSTWSPHPLVLHPPNTDQSLMRAQRAIRGEDDLCRVRITIDPERQNMAEQLVRKLAEELQLDHEYCLFLLRAVSSEKIRLWVGSKVQPILSPLDEQQTPGGLHVPSPDPTMPIHEDLEASARYLFFIEKRAAMNTLLELTQSRMGEGFNQTKQHAIHNVTNRLIQQGLSHLLMQRVLEITRERTCRGRTALEVEYEMERQRASECLFFLYYGTQILPRELLSVANREGRGGRAPRLATGEETGRGNHEGTLTLVGLVKALTRDLKDKFKMTAPGEEKGKAREERSAYRALVTCLMALVAALLGRGELEREEGGEEGNGLVGWLLRKGGVGEAVERRREYERERKQGGREVTRRQQEFEQSREEVQNVMERAREELENDWDNFGCAGVVYLALAEAVWAGEVGTKIAYLGIETGREVRVYLLRTAIENGVFAFIEGAIVGPFGKSRGLGEGGRDLGMFVLDMVCDLLAGLMAEQGELLRALPGSGRRSMIGTQQDPPHSTSHSSLHDPGLRRASLDSFVSLLHSLSEVQPELLQRIIWSNVQESEPVNFVKDVADLSKSNIQILPSYLNLLLVLSNTNGPLAKLATLDFLLESPSPFAQTASQTSPPDLLTYILESSIAVAETNQNLGGYPLLPTLTLLRQLTHPIISADYPSFIPHILRYLFSLLMYPLSPDLKGATFKALAAFAGLPGGIGRQIWEMIERLGIIPHKGQRTALRKELETAESPLGMYPISEGFLTLLVALIKADLPYDLGEGRRHETGLQPYMDYVVEDLLLPARYRRHDDPGQLWKIMALSLEAMVALLERYPLDYGEDRLRSLGMDAIQRSLAKDQLRKDLNDPAPPSAAFQLLLLLLRAPTGSSEPSLFALLLEIILGSELGLGARAGSMVVLGEEELAVGPVRLEGRALVREQKCWDEAVRVFDDEGRSGGARERRVEELKWQEECVAMAFALLCEMLLRDDEWKGIEQKIGGEQAESQVDDDHRLHKGQQFLKVKDLMWRGVRQGSAGRRKTIGLATMLPLMVQWISYEPQAKIRLRAMLVLRDLFVDLRDPNDLVTIFTSLSATQSTLNRASLLRLLSQTGESLPPSDIVLNLSTLSTSLTYITQTALSPAQIDHLTHYLLLDTLVDLLLPHKLCLPHILLGYQPSTPTLTLPPHYPKPHPLHFLTQNLLDPSFPTVLASRSHELLYQLIYARRTSLPTLHYLHSEQIDYFQQQLTHQTTYPLSPPTAFPDPGSYASHLHSQSWFLRSLATALYRQAAGDNKPHQLLDFLLSATPPSRSDPSTNAEAMDVQASMRRESRKEMVLLDLILQLPLLNRSDVPRAADEQIRQAAERYRLRLPGSVEMHPFYGISTSDFINELRLSQASWPADNRVQEERPIVVGPARGGRGTGEERDMSPYLQTALSYALQYNQFAFRQAGEHHYCQAWRRLCEIVLLQLEQSWSIDRFQASMLQPSAISQADLRPVLTIFEDIVDNKMIHSAYGDSKALNHLAVAATSCLLTLSRYAAHLPSGLPESLLSLTDTSHILSLLLTALLSSPPAATHRTYRAHICTAILCYLQSTTLHPLPSPHLPPPHQLSTLQAAHTLVQKRCQALANTVIRHLHPSSDASGLLHLLLADSAHLPHPSVTRQRQQALALSTLSSLIHLFHAADPPSRFNIAKPRQYQAPLADVISYVPRLVDDLEAQFCLDRSSLRGSREEVRWGVEIEEIEKDKGRQDRSDVGKGMSFRLYFSLLAEVAQDQRGARRLLDCQVIEKLGRTRALWQLESEDAPTLVRDKRDSLLGHVECVVRFMQVMLSVLGTGDAVRQVAEWLRSHVRVIEEYVLVKRGTVSGLEEVGAVIAMLAHLVGMREVRVDEETRKVLGRGEGAGPDPLVLAPYASEFRRMVNDLFEVFSVELLPPSALRYASASTQGWWMEVDDECDQGMACEPPPGIVQSYSWRLSDTFKLHVSQTLLLHLTTYIRRRLQKGSYPNIRYEVVLESLQKTLDFLMGLGDRPDYLDTSPGAFIPHLSDIQRAAFLSSPPGQVTRLPWNYDFLHVTLRDIMENLLRIFYHLIVYRSEIDPDFPREDLLAMFVEITAGRESWIDRQARLGGFPFLRVMIEAIEDRLRS